MHLLLEDGDIRNTPVECFHFDSDKNTFPVKPHWHYYMEILYMTQGVARINSDKEEYILHCGEMIIFHPKTVHAIFSDNGSPVHFIGLKLDISRINMNSNYSPKLRSIFRFAEKNHLHTVFTTKQVINMNAKQTIQSCLKEYNNQKYCYDLVIRSELYKLLIEILRCWQEKGFVIGSEIYDEDGRYDIYNITEYIDENLNSDLRVKDIANACGMSYSHFAKKFNQVYHEACKSYIEDMRIHKVKDFLIFTNFDLTYISQETGFSDSSHMIKSFKKATGYTPIEYRKTQINYI